MLINGAGSQNRTDIKRLETSRNNHYTIPAIKLGRMQTVPLQPFHVDRETPVQGTALAHENLNLCNCYCINCWDSLITYHNMD